MYKHIKKKTKMYVRIGKNTTQTDRKENFTNRQKITQIQTNKTKNKNRRIENKKVTTK